MLPLSSENEDNGLQTVAKMRHFSTLTNLLQIKVESKNLRKKQYVQRIEDDKNIDVPDFLRHLEEEILELTVGFTN